MHDDDDDDGWMDEVQTWTRLYYVYTAVQAIFGDFRRIALVKKVDFLLLGRAARSRSLMSVGIYGLLVMMRNANLNAVSALQT